MNLRSVTLLVVFFAVSNFQSFSQNKHEKIVSAQKETRAVLFQCENGETIKVSIATADIFRVQVSPDGKFEESMMIKWGYVKDDFPLMKFDLSEDENKYEILTSSLTIQITKEKFRMKVLDKDGNLILRNNDKLGIRTGDVNVLNFDMPADEHFFGFGFMRKTLDARGHKLTWKRGYRWNEATVPFFLSTRGYAFYSNSTFNHEFDFTSKSDSESTDYYSVSTKSGQIDFYIIYGMDFPKLLDRYTDLTGKSMMVPRWGFGLEYRVRYYADQNELLDIAREFRRKEIPCDIMALCPGWEERAYAMNWKWSSKRYPQTKKMFGELEDMGFKVEMWESGVAPKENITDPQVRKKWANLRKGVIADGVKAFMQDDPYPRSIRHTELLKPVLSGENISDTLMKSEQLNNISNTLYTETLFNEYREQTGERAMVIFHAYSASVASHRWPLQWAGDYQAANGLLNASLSGHAMVSHDIRNPYAAGWHQGFFIPFSVVNSWAYYREPWLYSESIEQSHRLYACLRSRLVPYFYSSLWQSHKTGLPIQRPMALNYHHDPVTHKMKSQFMIGDWFLLGLSDLDDGPEGEKVDFWTGSQRDNEGRIYLPKGKWINYWNGETSIINKAQWVSGDWPEYMGGHLFVKAGAIIPMGQVKNYIGETKDEVMILDVYPHQTSSYQLYEDDGVSYKYEKGQYAITDIVSEAKGNSVKLAISQRKGKYDGMPGKRTFLVKMHSNLKPENIAVDGVTIPYFKEAGQLIYNTDKSGWYFDHKSKKAIIKLDKGWKYGLKENGVDPLATIPPTAKYEIIEWDSNISMKDRAREIIVQYPEKAVLKFYSNIAALPADGISQADVGFYLTNEKETVKALNLKIEGPAKLLNGRSESEIDISEHSSFKLVAGDIPGIIKVSLVGKEVEPATFELPVYGKPTKLKVEKSNTVLVADNENELQIFARLYDESGHQVLTAGAPLIVKIDGNATFTNKQKIDTVEFTGGVASFSLKADLIPGNIKVSTVYNGLKGNLIETSSRKGEMQVRINPPEKIHLDSDGGWIPDQVDVFVNFKADGKLVKNSTREVMLNVYDKQHKLLDTYRQPAKKGEVIFKDITYYTRPAQCLFEIKCEGYETITRKVFENTWHLDPEQ